MAFYQNEYSDPETYDAEYGSYLPDGPYFEPSPQKGADLSLTWLVEQGG